MKKKKVLFTATVDSHILLFHLPYLKYFKEKGYEVHVATSGDEKIPYCDNKIKVSFERSPYKLNNVKAIFALKKEIEKNKYDIIHTHTPMGAVITRIAAKRARKKLGTKVIYTAHGFHFYKGSPKKFWMLFYPVEKFLSKYTDLLITINNEDYEIATKKFKTNVEYVKGVGLNEEKFNNTLTKKEKLELRKSLGLKEDDFVLIYAAELSKRKNQEMLLKALSDILKVRKNIHILLPGLDSMNEYHKKLAIKLDILNNVHFLGFRDDINKLLQISDIAVSTSNQEGLPVNIMEAMYLGLPILATNCRGNRDLVEEDVNGWLVDTYDTEAFKEKFIKIYNLYLKGKLDRYKNSSTKLVKPYMLDSVMESMDNIYTNITRKNILHLLSSNIYSGAENVACNIIKNSDCNCYYCSPDGTIKRIVLKKNIKFIPLKYKLSLKKIAKRYNIDIIHAHDYKASILASFLFKGKIISHLHNNCPFAKSWNLKTIVYNYTIKKYHKVVAVSDKVYDEAIFKDKLKNKFMKINNYIDYEDVINQSNESNSKKYDVFFIGRLTEQKNPVKFIEVIEEIQKQNKNIKAVMIGDGELKDLCYKKIKEKRLENNIEMVGFKSNPFPIIKNSKVGIMPSSWEGFGLTAVESMILEKPVLNSGAGGLSEIFKHNPEFITEDYAIKTLELLSDDKKYKEMVKATKKIIKPFIDRNKWQDMIKKIYR